MFFVQIFKVFTTVKTFKKKCIGISRFINMYLLILYYDLNKEESIEPTLEAHSKYVGNWYDKINSF